MRKMLLMFAVMFSYMGGWAQTYQKIPHTKWTVTALNEAGVSGNEGGIAFLKDENPATFWHSDYSDSYSDGTNGKKKGQDGLQCFMVDMSEVCSFDRITYAGRSNGNNNWATKVRVYAFEELPTGWHMAGDTHKALSALTYAEKEDLLKKENNLVLGTPIFDNNNAAWASDQNIKTIDFAEAKSGRYILFVADATSSDNGYLTCSDFNLWQKIEGIVEDKPYFLKLTNIAGADESDWYLDTNTPIGDTSNKKTIGKSETKTAATYFTLHDGYWYISTLPGALADFVSVDQWCATPLSEEPTPWLMDKEDGTILLRQNIWEAGYLGGDNIITGTGGNTNKVYTNQEKTSAVKLELVSLTDEELQNENRRVAERKKHIAAEEARTVLGYIGVGYPAENSEARAILQEAIDADDATYESICEAIVVYQSSSQTVLLPEAGKVYRLVSASPTFSDKKVVYSDNTELKWQSKNEASMNQLWTVESINGMNLSLMNVGDAAYSQVSGFTNPVRTLPAKNESSLTFLGKGQFRVMCNKAQSMHANGNGNGANASGNIINSNDGLDSYSAWYFEEVAVTKEILAAQINSIKTAYLGSLLLKSEGVVGLQEAVDKAQEVYDTDGNYAVAFSSLVESVNSATLDYIDLGYFYIKSKGAQKYAYNNNNTLYVADSKSPKSIFKMSKAKNGTYYIQNGNGYYVQNTGNGNNTAVPISTNKVEYTITKMTSGHYVLRQTSSAENRAYWHDANNGTGKLVGWESVADNSQWTFEPLSEEEVEKIYTVNLATCDASHYLSYTGEYAGDKDVKANGGFYVLDEVPTETDLNVQNIGDYASTVNIDAIQRNIKVVTGVLYNSNIYILRCLKDNTYARYHSGCQLSANDKTNMMTWQGGMVMESLFYIEEGTDEYAGFYTIRSYAAPTMYAYNLGTDNANSKVAMKEAPTEGDLTGEYYWKITYREENGKPANITPYHNGGNTGDNYGWNKRGAHDGKSHIGYWYESDKDCNATSDNKWYVRTVEEELTALGKLPLPQYTSDNSVIGLATYESVEPVIGFDDVINASGLTSFQNIAAYVPVVPKAGTFFKLKNEESGNYMTATNGTTEGSVKVKATPTVESIFYVDKDSTLLSYAFGRYLDCNDKKLSDVGTKHGGIYHGAQVYGFKENILMYRNNSHWTYGNKADEEAIDRGSSMPNNDKGYNWIFEPVTEIPVTISAVEYATFYAPCNVTLPEGLTAYYVSNVGNGYATLTEVEGRVVPANTGVLLKGNANTYYLTIGGEATEIENKLTGTVASEYINTTSYVLATTDVEGRGFYKASKNFAESDNGTFTKVGEGGTHFLNNGFKAYLPASVVPSAARFLSFDFGTETAIESIEGAENGANAVIYDLSGRRVQKAQKGLYIVNGVKVIK